MVTEIQRIRELINPDDPQPIPFDINSIVRVTIGTVIVDASLNEEHAKRGELTEYRIEDGSNISDHFILYPDDVRIQGIITNTPIYQEGGSTPYDIDSIRALEDADDPVQNAWGAVGRYFVNREVLTIKTSLETYENMMLTEFAVTRDATKGQSLHFEVFAKKLVTTATEEVEAIKIPKTKTAGKNKNKKGRKNTEEATGEKKTSILLGLGKSLIGS